MRLTTVSLARTALVVEDMEKVVEEEEVEYCAVRRRRWRRWRIGL